ncbi:nucleotide-diphospho-sugar transferase [Mucilaginibacter sp. AW1-3]
MKLNYRPPVLFLIFNRPECTQLTFNAIKKNKPNKLYIAADGPRASKNGEHELCAQTRAIVADIDWDCEVHTLFREKNLGCKVAVNTAITWFFENEEMGIILEDDCLPSESFFSFCADLLIKYKDDDRVWHIDGTTSQANITAVGESYHFSKYCLIWGWATWRRAWNYYDPAIKSFPDFEKNNVIKSIWAKPEVQKYWLKNFKDVYNGQVDTWDFQWMYTVWTNNGMSIRPSVNLIKNIGFDNNATHTKTANKLLKEMKNEEMTFPLQHPVFSLPNTQQDDICSAGHFNIHKPYSNISKRVVNKIKRIIKR